MGILLQIAISKNEINQAEEYLQQIKEIYDKTQNKGVNRRYRVSKALLLKTKPRITNLAKALKLLKEVIEEDAREFNAIINLCDILLIDLRNTNDIEVVDEIKDYIGQLLNIAENSHSYSLQAEAYLLQAKLSLLTFNIKKAQRFLTQAQQIAERFGLNKLATKIANEYTDLLKKIDLWEKLKEIDAPMADRFELARLDEQMGEIIQKSAVLIAQVTEEKVAISLKRRKFV